MQVHGWLMCLGWGCLIPIGVVIAAFRTVRGFRSWWFYLHATLQVTGFLVALAGITVGTYLEIDQKLQWQHRVIGITVTVLGGLQVSFCLCWTCQALIQIASIWSLLCWACCMKIGLTYSSEQLLANFDCVGSAANHEMNVK